MAWGGSRKSRSRVAPGVSRASGCSRSVATVTATPTRSAAARNAVARYVRVRITSRTRFGPVTLVGGCLEQVDVASSELDVLSAGFHSFLDVGALAEFVPGLGSQDVAAASGSLLQLLLVVRA